MHLLISLLMICSFFILILAGLISVLRDMLGRDWAGTPAAEALNLDLSRDFDHSLRREVEAVDHLRRVAIQKSE
jgi:hypothetical protein